MSLFLLLLNCPRILSAELKISDLSGEYKKSTTDLLKFKDLKKVTLNPDPVYSKKMIYKAVPLKSLLSPYKTSVLSFVEIKALDGFAAVFPLSRLIENKKAEAYLAIEETQNPWPKIKRKKQSAGPFYLIWEKALDSDVLPEEWPFQIASISIFDDLKSHYPKIYPHKELAHDHVINRGFKVFLKNCFVCHTMNQEGASQMGPDLNLPMNPTEYLTDEIIFKLIRNSQDLRYWPKSQMSHFPPEVLSDSELKDLLAYLKHMADKKYPIEKKSN